MLVVVMMMDVVADGFRYSSLLLVVEHYCYLLTMLNFGQGED